MRLQNTKQQEWRHFNKIILAMKYAILATMLTHTNNRLVYIEIPGKPFPTDG